MPALTSERLAELRGRLYNRRCDHNMPKGCCALCITERKRQDIHVPYKRDPWGNDDAEQ